MAKEIVPVKVKIGKDKLKIVEEDEEPLRFNEEALGNLRPAFRKGGTITAGNASTISDGAAFLVLTTEEEAIKRKQKILAYIMASAVCIYYLFRCALL